VTKWPVQKQTHRTTQKMLRTRRRNRHLEKTIFSYKQAYIVPKLMVIKMYTHVVFLRPTDKLLSVNPLQTNI